MKHSLAPYKMCLNKNSYLSKKTAEEELDFWIKRSAIWGKSDKHLKVYKCNFCFKYHLGNKNKGK